MSNDADGGAVSSACHHAMMEGGVLGFDEEESPSSPPEPSNHPECAQEPEGGVGQRRRNHRRDRNSVRTSRCCGSRRGTCTDILAKTRRVLIKYLWDGQKLASNTRTSSSEGSNNDPGDRDGTSSSSWCLCCSTTLPPRLERRRKWIATLTPAIIVHVIWWSISFANQYFHLFTEPSGSKDQPRYLMSITMIFGSMIAGATSEGGAAVAFPVMTLALGVSPTVARDFSFMVQTVGMGAASFTILTMRVAVESRALIHVTIGGVVGLVVGLELVAPYLPPAYAKMYFVVIWSSFAVGLYLLNRNHGRKVNDRIPNWEEGVLWRATDDSGRLARIPEYMVPFLNFNWKAMVLFIFGVTGGIFSAVAGSGIDICSFAVLTLLYRVDEKVATPTSVVLMAINAAVGFAYRELIMGGVESDAWGYLYVCVPVVVVGAPLGSFLGSHFHRLTLAGVIYVIDAAQLFGALYVVRPWTTRSTDTPLILSLTSLAMFVCGLMFFSILSHLGLKSTTTTEDVDKDHGSADIMLYERGETVDSEESSEDDDASSRYSGGGRRSRHGIRDDDDDDPQRP